LDKTQGLVFSQGVLLKLMDKGLRRKEAYNLIQKASFRALKAKTNLKTEILKDKKILKYLSFREIADIFQPKFYLRNVKDIYKRFGLK